jgi:hypothetical protein
MSDGVEALVTSMRNVLGITLEEFRSKSTVTDAYAALRARVETAGVFVLLMGNLGTHHTDIDVRVFRGFALADDVAGFGAASPESTTTDGVVARRQGEE